MVNPLPSPSKSRSFPDPDPDFENRAPGKAPPDFRLQSLPPP
jgi:hypothetical protein